MPVVILVPLTGTESDSPVMAASLTIAGLTDGHVAALHVRPDVQRDIANLAGSDLGMGAGLDGILARMEESANAAQTAASLAWRTACDLHRTRQSDQPGEPGVSSSFTSEMGDEAEWIAAHGRAADMIVAVRSGDNQSDTVEAALMHSGRPVLIAAPHGVPVFNGVIAIAWKDTPEASRAVAAALPFIARASKVVVLTVSESGDDDDPSVARLARYLRWHNRTISVQRLRRGPAEAIDVLMSAAEEAGAGLLVMGAYGHTRLREAVFGGFTRSVLKQAPMAVLLAH